MNFKLVQHKSTSTRTHAVFHVIDSAGTTVGHVSIPPDQINDLLKHWRGAEGPAAAAAQRPGVKLKPLPPMSRQAILRGC